MEDSQKAPGDAVSSREGAAALPLRAERGGIQSVDRAVALLDQLANAGAGGIPLTELSRRVALNISTCHHLLATLVKRGYVAQVPGRRSYALGARVLALGTAFLNQVDLPRRAQPFVERINERTGETVQLAVMQGDAAVTLLKSEGRHAVRVDAGTIGGRDPMHATATGKAMLAWLPEDEIRRIVMAQEIPRYTHQTITDFAELIEDLRLVRRKGYSLDREEHQPGVLGVGAVVRNHSGTVVGALSATAPTQRVTDAHLVLLREEVTAAARALSDFSGQGRDAAPSPYEPQTAAQA